MAANRALALLAAAVVGSLGVPSAATARVPTTIDIETCWFGVCNGVVSRYHTRVPAPIFSPNSGELWNSQGYAGDFFVDPVTNTVSFVTYRFPIGIYSGSFVNGCFSGTATQYYYNGYGTFESVKGCP